MGNEEAEANLKLVLRDIPKADVPAIGRRALAIAEQDGRHDLFLDQPGGGFDDADVLTFRENNPFRVPAELVEQVGNDVVAGLGF
jgi:hypothetical protein